MPQKLIWSIVIGSVAVVAALIYTATSPRSSATVTEPSVVDPSHEEAHQMVKIRVFDRNGELVGPVESPKVVLSDSQWQERLSPEQYRVLRSKGTERPFCGTLLDNKMQGVYTCAGCGLPLFSSDSKFNSGTGWPSFFQPISKENVTEHGDTSHGMVRTEILCARCDGHLGHVFDDGPRPTGLRFCLNSESLEFTPSENLAKLADPVAEQSSASSR